MKKALLILFGGRSMPNMLTILHEKPDIIIAIVSEDQKKGLPQLKSSIEKLFKDSERKPEIYDSYLVNAFDCQDVKNKCVQSVKDHSDYDWIFNITAATTIMSIGAYEAAKELIVGGTPIRCWYLNTLHNSVVSLIGEGGDAGIFTIFVDEYVTVYNRQLAVGLLEDQRQYCQDHWIPFARFLVQNSSYIDELKLFLKETIYDQRLGRPSKKGGAKKYTISFLNNDRRILLEEANKVGLLELSYVEEKIVSVKLNYLQANYLDGPWLEAYVWDEACKLKIFSDCQWNQRLVDPEKPDNKDAKNEIDVSMIYQAQLIIAECKTGEDAFESANVYKLDSVSEPLGGRFVSKMLITSLRSPDDKDPNKRKEHEDFNMRVDERGIVVITRDELNTIGEHIENLAKRPKRARI